jgi:hypothetical protein
MFKNIFQQLSRIVCSPARAWDELGQRDEEQETFFSRYLYPLMGLVALAAFAGVFFSRKEFDLEIALKSSIKALVAAFGGFYVAVYLMNELWMNVFQRQRNVRLWYYFTGYASSPMFALHILLALLPEFFFLRVAVFYTAWVIWVGAVPYMHVTEDERMKFTVLASAVIIVAPLAIDFMLFLLMPGLRF